MFWQIVIANASVVLMSVFGIVILLLELVSMSQEDFPENLSGAYLRPVEGEMWPKPEELKGEKDTVNAVRSETYKQQAKKPDTIFSGVDFDEIFEVEQNEFRLD